MEQLDLHGRVALVTGAGGGLGASHARLLASRGARVVVNDLNQADSVVEQIRSAGGTAIADAHDVSTSEGGRAMVERAIDEFGSIDIVVNNAGVIRDKSFHSMTEEMVDLVLAVHVRGAFNVTQPAFRHMRERGYGRIVNTSSGAGLFGNFGQANYSAAKAALVGFTRTLAVEGGPKGIKANALAPMAFTPMTDHLLDGSVADLTRPELVSPVVALLASEECPVNGEVITAGAGRVMRTFIATTTGYRNNDLTPEDLAANWDTVMDSSEFVVPSNAMEEQRLLYGTTLTVK
ncbi:SDR family NAD(P)-dependent oxidoreductase [Rhodococcus sp. 2H158]